MSKLSTFADRFMRLISGQQPLPQSIFRSFISEVEEVISGASGDTADKADKVDSAVEGNFAALDSNGNLADSGKKPADFVEASSFSFDTDTLTIVVGGHTYAVSATEVTSAGQE